MIVLAQPRVVGRVLGLLVVFCSTLVVACGPDDDEPPEPPPSSPLQLAAGINHTCFLAASGQAYCWGLNAAGQLGDGTLIDRLTPVAVIQPDGLTFAKLTVGAGHSCGLSRTGKAWCWGSNGFGGLGTGSYVNESVPAPVVQPAATTFRDLHAGFFHTCAVTQEGQAWCWGRNTSGQLGDSSFTDRLSPTAVRQPGDVTFAQVVAGDMNTCAVTSAGMTFCWGSNTYGALGIGTSSNEDAAIVPVAVHQPSGVTFRKITLSYGHTCGLTTAGQAWCWGRNVEGQLGDGGTEPGLVPAPVSQPMGVTFDALAAGGFHTCGGTVGGAIFCWGDNLRGQLGDGSQEPRLTPVAVAQPPGLTLFNSAAGSGYSCGLNATGSAYCWGGNQYGQVGDGTTSDRLSPVAVAFQ